MTSHREEKLNVIPILLDHYPERLVSQGTLSYPHPFLRDILFALCT